MDAKYKTHLIIQEIDRKNEARRKEHLKRMKKLFTLWNIDAALDDYWCECVKLVDKQKEPVRPRSFCEKLNGKRYSPHLNVQKIVNDLKAVHAELENNQSAGDNENGSCDKKMYAQCRICKNCCKLTEFTQDEMIDKSHQEGYNQNGEQSKPSSPGNDLKQQNIPGVEHEKSHRQHCPRYNGLQDNCQENHCKRKFSKIRPYTSSAVECSRFRPTNEQQQQEHIFWSYPKQNKKQLDETRRCILKEMVAHGLFQ